VHDATDGEDGWVSLEVSPLLANDTAGSIKAAAELHRRAARPNLFIKIPGTQAGVRAIEESIFAGVPINVTLLFSMEQYVAAANAYLNGIERRIAAGLDPRVGSVASIFGSRWDVAVHDRVPERFRNRLGIAMAERNYQCYRDLLASARWQALEAQGARAQRLLWASTGTKDPEASDTLYVEALAAPNTINTMPEKTLHAFEQHGRIKRTLLSDGGDPNLLSAFEAEGVSEFELATQLQREGAQAFDKSWQDLLACIAQKRAALKGGPESDGSEARFTGKAASRAQGTATRT
jgi:transaldolase